MTTDAGIEAGNVTSATGSGSVLDTAAGGGAVQEALHDAGRGIGVCPVCAKLLCILSLLIRCTIYAQTAETTTRVIGMTTAETDGTTDETIDGMTVDVQGRGNEGSAIDLLQALRSHIPSHVLNQKPKPPHLPLKMRK